MAKFKIYDPNKKREKSVCLRIIDGGVSYPVLVKVVDPETGTPIDGGSLFAIKPNGKLHRFTGVFSSFGFKLDAQGRIELSK